MIFNSLKKEPKKLLIIILIKWFYQPVNQITGPYFRIKKGKFCTFENLLLLIILIVFKLFLCLEPSGKPQVTAAHNTSSTSVYLEWMPPPIPTIHGEFQVLIGLLVYGRLVG